MPSKYGFKTNDERDDESREQARRAQERAIQTEEVVLRIEPTMMDILNDYAKAHGSRDGPQRSGFGRSLEGWHLSILGLAHSISIWVSSDNAGSWFVPVSGPTLYTINEEGPYSLELYKLAALIHERTGIPTLVH